MADGIRPRATRASMKCCGEGIRRAACATSRTCCASVRNTASASTKTTPCQPTTACSFSGRNTMPERFDAIVIGAGQAGPALCARLDKQGLKTALVERKLLGGTCVNNGCIPTKTLVASARAMHMARRGAEYGFTVDGFKADMRAVKGRKDGVVKHSTDGLGKWIDGMKNVTLLRGHACFSSSKTIELDGQRVQADKIFINVGGRALVPDIPGIGDVPYLTNATIMDLDFIPQHLLIIGGSYIGLEFAQMYRRFGSKVTVIEKAAKLLPREDDDVAAGIREALESEGVTIRTGAECMALRKQGERIAIEMACQGGAPLAEGSHLLMAVGR